MILKYSYCLIETLIMRRDLSDIKNNIFHKYHLGSVISLTEAIPNFANK